MSKHTPGPWTLSGANTVHGPDCIVAFVGTADEEVRKFSSKRQNADAYLIAAAPELLAALEELLPDLQCRCDVAFTSRGRHQSNTFCHHEDNVKAAIAKARGK